MGIGDTLLYRNGFFEAMVLGPDSPGHVTTQTEVLGGLNVMFTTSCVD
jgi:hypothetical protein